MCDMKKIYININTIYYIPYMPVNLYMVVSFVSLTLGDTRRGYVLSEDVPTTLSPNNHGSVEFGWRFER